MGIIYKVKPKIKELVLKHKKEDPFLSCRQLANIIQKKTGLNLSKSSINTIIKQAGLSNPVGRRRISLEIKPTIELPKLIAYSEKPILPATPETPTTPEITQPIEIQKDRQIEPEGEIPEIIQPVKSKAESFDSTQDSTLEIKSDRIYDNLGYFILKAAEWQVEGASILGKLIKENLSQLGSEQDLGLKSDILFYIEAFGMAGLEGFQSYQQDGLWVLNKADRKVDYESMLKFVTRLASQHSLNLAIVNEYAQISSEVNYFKFILSDGRAFYIDGSLRTIWEKNLIPESLSTTLYVAKSYVIKLFLDNVQTVQIFTMPGYNSFSQIASEFIWAWLDMPLKRIVSISFCNSSKQEIEVFKNIPPKKRFFMIGFWPWQEEGDRFIREDLKIVKSIFSEELSREVFFSENLIDIGLPQTFERTKLRVGLIRNAGLDQPRSGILTNLPMDNPMSEIVLEYLTRWPNLEEGYQDFLKKTTPDTMVKERTGTKPEFVSHYATRSYGVDLTKMDIWEGLRLLLSGLNDYVQKHYLSPNSERLDFPQMRQRFYSLSGKIEIKNQNIFINLLPAKDYSFKTDLLYICQRLNESDIHEPSGKRIWFKL